MNADLTQIKFKIYNQKGTRVLKKLGTGN